MGNLCGRQVETWGSLSVICTQGDSYSQARIWGNAELGQGTKSCF